jgi:acetyl esterase/lipase
VSTPDASGPLPDAVLRYDERPDAVIDVFLPEDEAHTLATFVHGGFWRAAYDRTHVRPLAKALARDGFAVTLPEYRRVGEGGGWPTTCDDVRAAVTATPALLEGIGVTPARTVLTGHSAGGHLVLWLAATGADCDAVVPIAPVADLRAAAAINMGDGAVQAFLGGDEPVDAADPAVLLDSHRPSYPIRILHGTADDVVTIENSRGLVRRHPWVELVELPGVEHFAPVDPASGVYSRLVSALTA